MDQMGLAEILIFVFVALFFAGGIYGGIRLFRWSQKDRAQMQKRNEGRKINQK